MFYLFKIERCDAINLLSKHDTFDAALAAMKDSLVKKILLTSLMAFWVSLTLCRMPQKRMVLLRLL